MAAGIYPYCRGPLQGTFVGSDDQFSCPLSGVFTNDINYPYICTDNSLTGGDIYCDPYQTNLGLPGYRNCSSATNNGSEWEVVGCSLANTFSLALTPVSSSQINVSWPATSYVGGTQVEQVRIERYQCNLVSGNCWDDFIITVPSSPALYSNTGLLSNTTYYFWIFPRDLASNLSSSPMYSATTLSDSTPPSNITNLSVSSCSSASCSLSWTAPGNDGNVGTASSYDMRYSTSPINDFNWTSVTQATGEPVPTVASTTQSMNISGLSPTTTYYFAIKSSDGTNVSALSNVPTGTTTAVPDTIAPTSSNPNLQAARDVINQSSQINLSWNAYTDNVGVAGYRIERCQGADCSSFIQINTSVATNYSDISLSPSTSYSYRIRAYDAANNFSGYSNIASATTSAPPDTSAPNFTPTSPSDPLPAGTTSAILRGTTIDDPATCRYATSSQSFDSVPPMIQMTTTDGITHSAPLSGLSDDQSYTYYIKCRDGASTPNISGDFIVSFSVSAPPLDTSPPLISGGQPSGTLPFFPNGSGTVTMSVLTNEAAYCMYNQAIDTDFSSMATNPLNTNSVGDLLYQKYHFTTLTVSNGANYRYYVRCQDTTGPNTNTSGYPIIFSVDTSPNTLPTVDLTASPISGVAPLQVISSGTASDLDDDPLTYSLDWGDGLSESYAPNTSASHTYNNVDSYTVTLTVVDSRGGRASDMEYITVNASQQSQVLPPITGGICAVECNDNNACVSIYGSGFVCGPSHICIPEAVADVGPVRSGGYTSLTDGTILANFPTGTQAVMIGLTTDANAECRFAVDPLTNNGKAGVAYNFSGAGITMNQFSTSDYKRHSAIINIGTAKSCSPGTPNSCGYDKKDVCPTSGKCYSYGFSAVCRNTFGTLEPNTTDYPIRFTIGAPDLLACASGEMCPSGLPCPASNRCEPAPYTCLINQFFVKNNIPYLLDICFPGFTPALLTSNYCVPDGSCNVTPACEQTLTGTDNCGNSCQKTGSACSCTPTTCSASAPACGETTNGTNNCGGPCTRTGPVCASSFYGGNHTALDCTNAGGTVANDGTYDFCRFDLASCPSGSPNWLQYNNWSTTNTNICWNSDNTAFCGTGSHIWGDAPSPACIIPTTTTSCYQTVTQIGCY